MAVLIFSLGIFRDQAYQRAIDDQPTFAVDDPMLAKALLAAAGVFGGVGLTLVLSSTYQYGVVLAVVLFGWSLVVTVAW